MVAARGEDDAKRAGEGGAKMAFKILLKWRLKFLSSSRCMVIDTAATPPYNSSRLVLRLEKRVQAPAIKALVLIQSCIA
jgi:hypothetical protein